MTSRKTIAGLGELLQKFAEEGRLVVEMRLNKYGGATHVGWFAASCCKPISSFRATDHMVRVSHFRTWAKENPEELRQRFPEAVALLAESVLT